jgi:hypothetical protein
MLEILTYISLIAGGLLILLLLLGIIGGVDLDLDADAGADAGADSDPGTGGIGLIKGGLTFFAIGAWVLRLMLLTSANPVMATVVGVAAGAVAVYVMSFVVRYMMRFEARVNYKTEDALFREGKVYLRIPPAGEGIVRIKLANGVREFKARSSLQTELPTGADVIVEDVQSDGSVLVRLND